MIDAGGFSARKAAHGRTGRPPKQPDAVRGTSSGNPKGGPILADHCVASQSPLGSPCISMAPSTLLVLGQSLSRAGGDRLRHDTSISSGQTLDRKPTLTVGQMLGTNAGFPGQRFSCRLQRGNKGSIHSFLGAEDGRLPLLQLAAPVTGRALIPRAGENPDFGRIGPGSCDNVPGGDPRSDLRVSDTCLVAAALAAPRARGGWRHVTLATSEPSGS